MQFMSMNTERTGFIYAQPAPLPLENYEGRDISFFAKKGERICHYSVREPIPAPKRISTIDDYFLGIANKKQLLLGIG